MSEKFPEFGSDFWILKIVILSKILGYYFQKSGQLAAPKYWIQFFQIYPKKDLLPPPKQLDVRFFVGSIKVSDMNTLVDSL